MKRIFDSLLAIIVIILLIAPIILTAIAVRITSKGSVLYWSDRIGRNNEIFKMPKFRSMLIGTPTLATHLIENSNTFLTPIGGILRRLSLDEIPQLFSILKGEMTIVGPRPALFNQNDLILLRKEKGVDSLVPGITGWAQVNGRDAITIPEKVDLDAEYLNKQSFMFDLLIIKITIIKVLMKNDISH